MSVQLVSVKWTFSFPLRTHFCSQDTISLSQNGVTLKEFRKMPRNKIGAVVTMELTGVSEDELEVALSKLINERIIGNTITEASRWNEERSLKNSTVLKVTLILKIRFPYFSVYFITITEFKSVCAVDKVLRPSDVVLTKKVWGRFQKIAILKQLPTHFKAKGEKDLNTDV